MYDKKMVKNKKARVKNGMEDGKRNFKIPSILAAAIEW